MVDPAPVTRGSVGSSCQCTNCRVGRTTLWQEKEEMLKSLVFSTEETTPPNSPEPTVRKVCQVCRSVVGPGLSHTCSRATLNRNVEKLVKNSSVRTLNRILQVSLKTTFKRTRTGMKGSKLKLPRVGSAGGSGGLQVTVGQKFQRYVPPRRFTADDLMRLQVNLNLSDKVTM